MTDHEFEQMIIRAGLRVKNSYSVPEAAGIMQVSANTIRRGIQDENIRAYSFLGCALRVTHAELKNKIKFKWSLS